jgi:Flp pilus assembly protein TadD
MRRGVMAAICLAVVALLLSGCAGIREQAEAYQQRLQEMENRLERVEAGASRNAGLISDLQRRVEELERQNVVRGEQTL